MMLRLFRFFGVRAFGGFSKTITIDEKTTAGFVVWLNMPVEADIPVELEWLDITEQSQVEKVMISRQGHAMTSFQNRIVVSGGVIEGDQDEYLYAGDVYTCTPPEYTVELIQQNPEWDHRAYHTMIGYEEAIGGGKKKEWLYLLGGLAKNGACDDVWYSSNGISWELAFSSDPNQTMWSGRFWHTTSQYDGKIVLYGGVNRDAETGRLSFLSDVWTSSRPSEAAWTRLTSSLCASETSYVSAFLTSVSFVVSTDVVTNDCGNRYAWCGASSAPQCCVGVCEENYCADETHTAFDSDIQSFASHDAQGFLNLSATSSSCDQNETMWSHPRIFASIAMFRNSSEAIVVGGASRVLYGAKGFSANRQQFDGVNNEVWILRANTSTKPTTIDSREMYRIPWSPRIAASVTVFQNKLFVLGGSSDGTAIVGDFWCYGCETIPPVTTPEPDVTTMAPNPPRDEKSPNTVAVIAIVVSSLVASTVFLVVYCTPECRRWRRRMYARLRGNFDDDLREELLSGARVRSERTWILDSAVVTQGQAIGHGTSGTVYRGTFQGAPCAVKKLRIFSDEMRKTVFEEASMLSALRHPNIVHTFGVCVEDRGVLIVMELCETSLGKIIVNGDLKKWTPERRLRVALDVCCGMAFLHARNIVHRDLKPDNCIVGKDGKMKLCDFGVSRSQHGVRVGLRATGHAGSPLFMSPEALQGNEAAALDPKLDVYSFGIVCWMIATFDEPYREELVKLTPLKFMQAVCSGLRPEIRDDLSNDLISLLCECWHADAKMRPASFEEIGRRLSKMAFPVGKIHISLPPSCEGSFDATALEGISCDTPVTPRPEHCE